MQPFNPKCELGGGRHRVDSGSIESLYWGGDVLRTNLPERQQVQLGFACFLRLAQLVFRTGSVVGVLWQELKAS